MISFSQVRKSYRGGHEALCELSFGIETGELVFVVKGYCEREGEWEWKVLTDHDRANASTKLSLYLLERDG